MNNPNDEIRRIAEESMTTPEPVVSTPIDQHAKAVFALAEELGASPFSSEPPTEHIRRLIERLADELNVQAERIAGLERERDDANNRSQQYMSEMTEVIEKNDAAELALEQARAALEEERERCAKVCESLYEKSAFKGNTLPLEVRGHNAGINHCAAAIRALSTHQEKP